MVGSMRSLQKAALRRARVLSSSKRRREPAVSDDIRNQDRRELSGLARLRTLRASCGIAQKTARNLRDYLLRSDRAEGRPTAAILEGPVYRSARPVSQGSRRMAAICAHRTARVDVRAGIADRDLILLQ